ncbi:hypothetical protein EC912_107137 [Luteibacter rhizovicinus]|uniref:Uncharacterized protein n=1 Tax=Luteibacter rhizovicinus TaxID=242606 RepID=A0A4V2W3L3_9GAMM|nr:hypothetical protein [Luteibacter rhizovicinus]TCV92429.1 hypothetical protein EC912_107137 [Luteibacter rhizovicinus]
MNAVIAIEPDFRHHDLLIELGQLEMAMEHLAVQSGSESDALRPRIEQRMAQLREVLLDYAN